MRVALLASVVLAACSAPLPGTQPRPVAAALAPPEAAPRPPAPLEPLRAVDDPSFQLVRTVPEGARFLRDVRAIVFDEDDALRIEDDGRVVPFPELDRHQAHWDQEDITGYGSARIIALVGSWPGRASGAQLRFFDNGQTVYLAELVDWHQGHWRYHRLVEPFVGLGAWSNGCVITPALADIGPIFGPADPKFRPSIQVMGCTSPRDLPLLPPGITWADAFSSNAQRHAVLVSSDSHDVVLHHWTPASRNPARHVFADLTTDGLIRHSLEPWLVDERNPIVWRTPSEPVVFLRRKNLAVEDVPGMPTEMLGSVVVHHDAGGWHMIEVPDVAFERFAPGADGAIWMTGGGLLWRMPVPGTFESVRLPPVGATQQPSVPLDILPVDGGTLYVLARHGAVGSGQLGLFRYRVPERLGVAPVLRWPRPGRPEDIAEAPHSIGGLGLYDFAGVSARIEVVPAGRGRVLETSGIPNLAVWKEIERRWKARFAADPELAEEFRRMLKFQRALAEEGQAP